MKLREFLEAFIGMSGRLDVMVLSDPNDLSKIVPVRYEPCLGFVDSEDDSIIIQDEFDSSDVANVIILN